MSVLEWESRGGTPLHNARRNGIRWTTMEDHDLRDKWLAGASVAQLARSHERLTSAIEIRLCKIFGVIDTHLLPRSKSVEAEMMRRGMPASGIKYADLWHTNNGRHLMPKKMELDHLVNTVLDCAFRTYKLRHDGIMALGGVNNPNVAKATYDAYRHVQPGDVFPLYQTLIEETMLKFRRVFGLDVRAVRKVIYAAWSDGTPVDEKYREAIEFMLCKGRTGVPARFAVYTDTFRLDDAKSLRAACWNLRIDQPKMVECVSAFSGNATMVRKLSCVRERNNSALNFETPMSDEDYDYWANGIPFV